MATRAGATKTSAQPGSLLVVVHNFIARSPDELSLAKGDRIELIERDDDFGDGWFLGRHTANGNTGLFPEVYTTPAPKGTLQNSQLYRANIESIQKVPQDNTALMAATVASNSAAQQVRSVSGPAPITGSSGGVGAWASATQKSATTHADSPVMSETLSVIDEHINDIQAPGTSFGNGIQRETITSAYSAQPSEQLSYIAGQETDEEENAPYTEAEVLSWDAERVAEYLEDQGVEKSHCNVFREQEITGEVLLAMEQSSIFIKEFDLGPVGRRLKTWHKIKVLQDEVKEVPVSQTQQRRMSGYSSATDDASRDPSRSRASTMGSALPRALSTSSRPSEMAARSNTIQPSGTQAISTSSARAGGTSSMQSMNSLPRSEGVYRPSAQTIRTMQHSRRHSSMDSNANSVDNTSRASHRKQPSIDQKWQPGQTHGTAYRPAHTHTMSTDSGLARSALTPPASAADDGERQLRAETDGHRVLHKRSASATRSPISKAAAFLGRRSTQTSDATNPKSPTEPTSPFTGSAAGDEMVGTMTIISSAAANSRSSATAGSQQHSASATPVVTTSDGTSPLVTKLDYDDNADQRSPVDDNKATSPASHKFTFFSTHRSKFGGLRTSSDAVTKDEKQGALSEKDNSFDSPGGKQGVATPSSDNNSVDLQKSEAQSRDSQGSGAGLVHVAQQASTRRPRARTKTKKLTSAYTRGLENKSPAEQMEGCDYSGWMKKKSGSLMTTWKPRLFVLRGRRLSYYYADDDTEEKGLIDISFHRVLAAQNEMLTGLHASITGAGAGTGATNTPTSPRTAGSGGALETTAERDLKQLPLTAEQDEDNEGLFIFKLVPPRAGLAKGVSFTKPTVHYFAVGSRREGRLWMAALMKATIDRDADGVVTTTYNQKTISLAKARERKERPPALRDDSEDEVGGGNGNGEQEGEFEHLLDNKEVNEGDTQGLGIGLGAGAADASTPHLDTDVGAGDSVDTSILRAWAEKEAQLSSN